MRKLKLEDKIFLLIVILILAGGFIKPFFKPTSINTMENRTAYRVPAFDVSSFKDKSYQDNMEKAFSDQIPLVNKMKMFVKTEIVGSQKMFYEMLGKNNNYYYLSNGVYLYNDTLMYIKTLDDLKEGIEKRTSDINYYANILPNVKFYVYSIEADSGIDFRDNSKIDGYDYLEQQLDEKIGYQKLEIHNFEEFQKYFYKTDHHWNHLGSYTGYQQLVNMMTNDKSLLYEEEICFKNAMSGSKARAIGGKYVFRETFCGYRFDFPPHDTYINNNLVTSYGNYPDIIKNGSNDIQYGDFYGVDFGLISFDYHQPEKDNLLIIGDSYNNAIDLIVRKGKVGEVYNIGGHSEKNNLEIVKLILKELNKPESLITFVNDRPGHDLRYAINSNKIEQDLGWQRKYNFEEGIKETIKWYVDNQEWIENIKSGEYKNSYNELI